MQRIQITQGSILLWFVFFQVQECMYSKYKEIHTLKTEMKFKSCCQKICAFNNEKMKTSTYATVYVTRVNIYHCFLWTMALGLYVDYHKRFNI